MAKESADFIALAVSHRAEVKRASDAAREFAKAIGFSAKECEEICLAVTELASNLIKHTSGGFIEIRRMEDRPGIQIESKDTGPGIPDVEKAITDGYSTAGGLGGGLGAVNRLMDELEFCSHSSTGTHILCQRWLRPRPGLPTQAWLEFGIATRSFHGLPENGDTFIARQWETEALGGVIDGLGHGNFAQRAAQTARQYIEQHFDQSLDNLFRGAGRACRGTRGVVMALARFDLGAREVTVANVGNIEVRLIGAKARANFIVRRGVVGLDAPRPVASVHPWTPENLLIMHSDGLHTHWEWEQFRTIEREPPAVIAQNMLRTLGKIEDDATVLVVKNVRP